MSNIQKRTLYSEGGEPIGVALPVPASVWVPVTIAGNAMSFALPTGVEEFEILLRGVSWTAAVNPGFRLSTGGAYYSNTTYKAQGDALTSATGSLNSTMFPMAAVGNTADQISGIANFRKFTGNMWFCKGTFSVGGNANKIYNVCGTVVMAGEIDGVQFTKDSTGSAVFDAPTNVYPAIAMNILR